MLRSSLGFHTLTMSKWLLEGFGETKDHLIADFQKYSQQTHNIQIYTSTHGNVRIKFHKNDEGIEWVIRPNIWVERGRMWLSFIDVKINPKILSGIHDYITAATYDDIGVAIANFNRISSSISPLLGTFEDYTLKRTDYCFNCAVSELAPGCTYKQIMDLLKRADIPYHFKEWEEYDTVSHRSKSRPGSFYLTNDSVHINYYSKYMQLLEKSRKNIENEYPPIPPEVLDAAEDIIRFEVQCKHPKVYSFSRAATAAGNHKINKYESLLTPEFCQEIINGYFHKTIGQGHWYSLQAAISLVRSYNFNSQKENRLIDAQELVNNCRGVVNAKEAYQGDDLDAFKRTLKDLDDLRINPVTIPRRWGIGRIWNLLEMYYEKESKERMHKQFVEKILNDKKLLKQALAHK